MATWNIFGGRTWTAAGVDLDLPQAGRDEPRVALVAELADGGRRLTVAGTHLSFVPGLNLRQVRALQRHLIERGGPRPLLGDQPVVAAGAGGVAAWPSQVAAGRTSSGRFEQRTGPRRP